MQPSASLPAAAEADEAEKRVSISTENAGGNGTVAVAAGSETKRKSKAPRSSSPGAARPSSAAARKSRASRFGNRGKVAPSKPALVLTLRISSRQHVVGREDDVTLPHASPPEEAPWTGEEHVEPPSMDPEAAAYHAGLLEQGYSEEDALTYTQQYFPQFQR